MSTPHEYSWHAHGDKSDSAKGIADQNFRFNVNPLKWITPLEKGLKKHLKITVYNKAGS